MSPRSSLIEELEQVIVQGSTAQRAEILRRISDLFIASANQLNDQVAEVFEDVIGRLIDVIETRVRAELSERLAPLSNASAGVIRHLACDDEISVAGPVLSQSPCLTAMDLVEVAESKSQAHLLAISGRAVIEPAVTDVLVQRGESSVVIKAVGNPGARFSDSGFGVIVQRANTDENLSDRLAHRSDIPPHLFCSLLVQATEAVRKRLLVAAPPGVQADVHRAISKASEDIAASSESGIRPDYSAAIRRLVVEYQAGRLGETEVATFAQAKQFEETVAALSLLSEVAVDAIDPAINSERIEPTLILCRAAGFRWETVRAVLLLRPRHRTGSTQGLVDAHSDFNKLSVVTAKQIARFWQSRATLH